MAKKTFFEVEPDRIDTVGENHQKHYRFTYHEPGKKDQIGSYSGVVTSPPPFGGTWEATKFYRAGVAAYQVVTKRELTPREIELFEQRIKAYEQAATTLKSVPLENGLLHRKIRCNLIFVV